MKPILIEWTWLTLYSYPLLIGMAWGMSYHLCLYYLEKYLGETKGFRGLFWGAFITSWIGAKAFFLIYSAGEMKAQYIKSANFTINHAKRDGIELNTNDSVVGEAQRRLGTQARKTDVASFGRGGLLGLGAILTSTSAPLRTSPVKRGDWILRRLIGTPVPPPPADAGSIPAKADSPSLRQR